jgi:hypothetical protein
VPAANADGTLNLESLWGRPSIRERRCQSAARKVDDRFVESRRRRKLSERATQGSSFLATAGLKDAIPLGLNPGNRAECLDQTGDRCSLSISGKRVRASISHIGTQFSRHIGDGEVNKCPHANWQHSMPLINDVARQFICFPLREDADEAS